MSFRDDRNAEEVMEDLINGLRDVISGTKIDQPRYMELYSAVYEMCNKKLKDENDQETGSSGWWPFNRRKPKRITRRRQEFDENHLTSGRIIRRIDEFVDLKVKGIVETFEGQSDEEELVKSYLHEWAELRVTANVLNGLCSYINRHKLTDKTTYDIVMDNWTRTAYTPLQPKLTRWVLSAIENQRENGGEIPQDSIQNMIESFVQMGIGNSETQKLNLYKKNFEDQMIEQTENFYKSLSLEMIENLSMSQFMENIEGRLANEENRRRYLHSTSMPRLLKVCDNILIKNHLDSMNLEFKNLLNSDLNDDVGRMYRLILRLGENSLDSMKVQFQQYIIKTGLESLTNLGDPKTVDPKEFATTLIDFYQKYNALVRTAFESNVGFMTSFAIGFHSFLNNSESPYRQKSPELLARYCDVILKKSSKNSVEDEKLEDDLDQVINIFKNLGDKDIFQSFYLKALAYRLITQRSSSLAAELSMIGKLKLVSGPEYTMRFHKMYQDMGISDDLNSEYKIYLKDNNESYVPPIDFHVQILSTNWPISQNQCVEFSIPNALVSTVNYFNEFYNVKYNGRKLSWLYNLSRGDLTTNKYQKKYTFTASTYQMAILLMYNSQDNYTIAELVEATKLDELTVIQVVRTLLKTKLLLTEVAEDELDEDSVISLFKDYNNSKLRLNINTPLKGDKNPGDSVELKGVQTNRKFIIKAAIVRIMKMRKVLKEQQLIAEVLSQLAPKFIPQVEMIKNCIQVLIDDEYIELQEQEDEDEQKTYSYVA